MENKDNYKFIRLSEKHETYLISIRQEKIIPSHGKKKHFKRHDHNGISESWWYLWPGTYFLYEFSKSLKTYTIHKVIIQETPKGIYEEFKNVKYIPDWLYTIITSLPNFDDNHFNSKYKINIKRKT